MKGYDFCYNLGEKIEINLEYNNIIFNNYLFNIKNKNKNIGDYIEIILINDKYFLIMVINYINKLADDDIKIRKLENNYNKINY